MSVYQFVEPLTLLCETVSQNDVESILSHVFCHFN